MNSVAIFWPSFSCSAPQLVSSCSNICVSPRTRRSRPATWNRVAQETAGEPRSYWRVVQVRAGPEDQSGRSQLQTDQTGRQAQHENSYSGLADRRRTSYWQSHARTLGQSERVRRCHQLSLVPSGYGGGQQLESAAIFAKSSRTHHTDKSVHSANHANHNEFASHQDRCWIKDGCSFKDSLNNIETNFQDTDQWSTQHFNRRQAAC